MSAVTRVLICLPIAWIAACSSVAPEPQQAKPLAAIERVDPARYMGVWHEIAKYPNRFQRHCVGDTSATYSLRTDGTIQVANRCRTADGTMDEAIGTAYQVGEADSAKLKVRFAPWWLSWLPAVWGDYWIVDLDADYQLAAVSEPRRQYLWILSRHPKADPAAYGALLDRLRAQGFDLTRLDVSAGPR